MVQAAINRAGLFEGANNAFTATASGATSGLPASVPSPWQETPADATGSKNMLQLVHLRWIAVTGQVITVGFVQLVLGVPLPWVRMAAIIAALVAVNLVSLQRLRWRPTTS